MNTDPDNWTAEELAAHLPEMDAIIASWGLARLTPKVLARADRLQIVAYAGGSVKYFVTDALFERGIVLTHAAHCMANSVAEFSLMLALMGLRRPQDFDHKLKAGEPWPVSRDMCSAFCDLAGSNVGLLGMGHVGRRAAELFQAMGARVWAYDPYLSQEDAERLGVRKAELAEILSGCKIISVHLPSTEETHHLLAAAEFAMIQDGAAFINTARSRVVDEAAMTVELAKGRFWAAIDVFDAEPLPVEHPLRHLDNVLLTPHVAALSRDGYRRMTADMIDEIERWFKGEPLEHRVTRGMLATMA